MTDVSFESAARGVATVGASVDERDLVGMLVTHGEQEGAILERYRRFAEHSASPAIRYLVRLILEDEERHHRVLAELANAIAWEASPVTPLGSVPDLDHGPDSEFVAETKALLDTEQADIRELRKLRRRLAAYQDTTLWALLVDLMLLDTEKHVHILRFITSHME
jgi:bacterioferritin (cytochrome b1)